ncbi:mitochondrial carrier [Tuber magnatum]|uniref:Mitochondrial carrier n=1 Tax=Tuber magnatum TaxID=42249 RepID=A0A317SMC0_9PEZI|nr:mitochondrial carrier [Tuber magnatum]
MPETQEIVVDGGGGSGRKPQNHLVQGTSAAGARALGAQFIAFYFRAPVKAFFRLRVDYMYVPRAINPRVQANERWSLKQSTPGLLFHAVKHHGWKFIPNQVLPPLIANASIGTILYTSYLQALGSLYQPSSQPTKRVYPPPPFSATFQAGSAAGAIQSLVAAPLDALVVRFRVNDMLEGKYTSVWQYGKHKLHEIGLRGVFSGYTLSLLKESLGYGLFFGSFEYVKQQAYFSYLTWYYGRRRLKGHTEHVTIRPHYALEPIFLLLAGFSASVTQQAVQHPLAKIQDVHYGRLESIDYASKLQHTSALRGYAHGYEKTFAQCKKQAVKVGGWNNWLYKGFALNTLRQVPSTAAGLIVFELVRRKFGDAGEAVAIEYENSTILLS